MSFPLAKSFDPHRILFTLGSVLDCKSWLMKIIAGTGGSPVSILK
jgi:hypothetical protein